MISEIKDGKVIVEMSEKQAKVIMEYIGAQTSRGVDEYIASNYLDLDGEETNDIFFNLYDVLSDLYEEEEQ